MYINVLARNSIWVSGEISNLHEFCIFANRMSVEQIGVGQIEVQFDEKAVQFAFQAPIWVCTDTVLCTDKIKS